jgi:hypothetical protein
MAGRRRTEAPSTHNIGGAPAAKSADRSAQLRKLFVIAQKAGIEIRAWLHCYPLSLLGIQ